VDELINAATVSEVLTGTSTAKAVTPDALAGLWQRGTDIASASTLSLPAGGGGVFNVTGTTGVTGISSAQGGRCVKLRFAGALTITHNGTSLILPGAANITTVAGDVAEFINEAAADASGSNWRCFNYMRADGLPVNTGSAIASKTTNYTVTTSDEGKSIRFAGLSADATLTLPSAASCGDGFVIYVSNEDTGMNPPYAVTVDPNSAELIDGATTRKAYTGTRVTLLCDGTGWRTVAGTWVVVSSRQTISSGDDANFAHGQPVAPSRVSAFLINLTTEGGWAVGDRVQVAQDSSSAGTLGLAWGGDATNLFYVIASAGTARLFNKTTGASVTPTAGNWALHLVGEF